MSGAGDILVIKHGALGDIILSTAAFEAIRAHHPDASIVCLTTKPYAELLVASPYFDEIWVDSKPRLFQRGGIRRLRKMLASRRWAWVYDLQTSTRSTSYQWLLARPWPHISNASRFASHGYTEAARHTRHALENDVRQLAIAGVEVVHGPDVSWLGGDISGFGLPADYALLVPGGAAHRPEKRWPAEQYAALTTELVARGVTPVLVGTSAEAEALASIAARVPQAVNLCGLTNFGQLAELARGARMAVGNDTGPMHIIGAAGCPSTVLFSAASNPDRSRPAGADVRVLRARDLRELGVDPVLVSLTGQR